MLGNSINYAERVEESRQVEKIKKVLITQASDFLPSYYAVCYYGKSSFVRLLKLISLLVIKLENFLPLITYLR